ncbi:MAG: nitroreductase [Ruminococcus sp.]|nr:nitroreductase [Ruminococcus sp.]
MTELQAIQERHSVRKYVDRPINEKTLAELNKQIDLVNERFGLHVQYIPDEDGVFSGIVSKICGWSGIPGYIAMVGKDGDGLDELCGYAGERLVLYAQTLGLNTCWAGIFRRKSCTAKVNDGERLVLVIAIGYGVNSGHSRRSKTFSDVTDVQNMPDWFRAGVEAALLAPTARNQQKFFFTLDGDKPVAQVTGNAPFAKLDLGIVKYHFEAASGRTFE